MFLEFTEKGMNSSTKFIVNVTAVEIMNIPDQVNSKKYSTLTKSNHAYCNFISS